MSAARKNAFFKRLEVHSRPVPLPDRWTSRRSFSDPVARFRAMQAAVKGRVIDAGTFAAAAMEAGRVLSEIGASSAVLNDETPLDRLLPQDFPGTTLHRVSGYGPDEWRRTCAQADAGITSADALLAETGTVVCSSGPGRSRLVSLLPPVHIVLCPRERITTDLFNWLGSHGGKWPANTVLISGPSKTADIEQTMAVGMHGPRQLVVIIYSGEN